MRTFPNPFQFVCQSKGDRFLACFRRRPYPVCAGFESVDTYICAFSSFSSGPPCKCNVRVLQQVTIHPCHVLCSSWTAYRHSCGLVSEFLVQTILLYVLGKGKAVPLQVWSDPEGSRKLTLWRRNYFFLISAHPVYKMWIIQEPYKLTLWNKLHFEEKKTESIEDV